MISCQFLFGSKFHCKENFFCENEFFEIFNEKIFDEKIFVKKIFDKRRKKGTVAGHQKIIFYFQSEPVSILHRY